LVENISLFGWGKGQVTSSRLWQHLWNKKTRTMGTPGTGSEEVW